MISSRYVRRRANERGNNPPMLLSGVNLPHSLLFALYVCMIADVHPVSVVSVFTKVTEKAQHAKFLWMCNLRLHKYKCDFLCLWFFSFFFFKCKVFNKIQYISAWNTTVLLKHLHTKRSMGWVPMCGQLPFYSLPLHIWSYCHLWIYRSIILAFTHDVGVAIISCDKTAPGNVLGLRLGWPISTPF